ncbi:hypothetical protein MHYP_G00253400 [Metynnis hypsauchen]
MHQRNHPCWVSERANSSSPTKPTSSAEQQRLKSSSTEFSKFLPNSTIKVMEAGNHEGAVDEAEDTDELLCTDVDGETVSEFSLSASALPRDHCDLLLDAIDAHLSRLQTHSHGQVNGGKSKMEAVLGAGCLNRSNSASKDTGLGSTVPSTNKATATPDGSSSDHPDLSSVEVSRGRIEPGQQQDINEEHIGLCTTPSWQTGRARGSWDSKSEQCLWRLEKLLGSSTKQVQVKEQEVEEEDSVCTEDFSARFREEMLEPQEPNAGGAGSVSDAAIISSSNSGRLIQSQIIQSQNTVQNLSGKSCTRRLAGVPMRSFDSVTIDSNLDSVCTERVRQHLQRTQNNRTALETFVQSGSCARRLKNTQRHENQTLSSDEEGAVGEGSAECGRCYRSLRGPGSVQRREKKSQSRRNKSTTSTHSTTSKEKQDDKLRTESNDMELSFVGLQHQKATAVRVVERLREEVEEAERDRHTLQLCVAQTRTHAQLLRSELHKLQAQRDLCVKDFRALQEDQAALQGHTTACYYASSPHKIMNSSCVSVLEREEMERLLDSTKSELFSEQRRFRKKLDSVQEVPLNLSKRGTQRLEEVTQELEQREEESRSLREKCSKLEEKLTAAIKHRDELQQSVQSERVEQGDRLGALEKIIAQKELLLLGIQEEKSSLQTELTAVREENRAELTAALEQAQKEKEEEVERLKVQLTQTHEHELQMVHSQGREAKAAAIREQALTHTRNTESLHSRIQVKEQEVKRLQESVKQQQEVLRRREEELRGEAHEQVQKAVEREQDKFQEQMQDLEGRWRADVERERRNALALQNKVLELQTVRERVEELESEASVRTARLRALRDEHQVELQRLHRQLKQEAESEAARLKQSVKQSEKQLQGLKSALAECERVHQGAAERQKRQNSAWVQDIHTECVCLQELLTHNGLSVDTKHLSHSATVSEAVQALQSLRKPLQQLIISLQNRISSLTHTNQQISAEKELQRDQLTVEKERALNVLKEKLIQEHIEELSSMSRVRLGEDDDGLRRQLQAKDEELRQVQRNMAKWKEKTTKRLAQKFEEELSTELERRVSKPKLEPQRRLELLEGEMRHLTRNYKDQTDVASASSANIPDLASTPSSHDPASYKLLRHLQSRIRQLQADNETHPPSPVHLNGVREAGDLAGSYLETIAPVQERHVSQRSSVRTAPS